MGLANVNPVFHVEDIMEEQKKLQLAIDAIDNLCTKILQKENYQREMQVCVQSINESCLILLQENPQEEDILWILQDMMYGMEQKDEVVLLDVLRFGLRTKLQQVYNELENGRQDYINE